MVLALRSKAEDQVLQVLAPEHTSMVFSKFHSVLLVVFVDMFFRSEDIASDGTLRINLQIKFVTYRVVSLLHGWKGNYGERRQRRVETQISLDVHHVRKVWTILARQSPITHYCESKIVG